MFCEPGSDPDPDGFGALPERVCIRTRMDLDSFCFSINILLPLCTLLDFIYVIREFFYLAYENTTKQEILKNKNLIFFNVNYYMLKFEILCQPGLTLNLQVDPDPGPDPQKFNFDTRTRIQIR
jgi:hypothetical protein